jgi:F-type H+-transporting ATPase subunit delta
MQASGIGLRYARALLEIGEETGGTTKMLEELRRFHQAYAGSADLRMVLNNPSIEVEERKALVKALARRQALGAVVTNFLQLLVDKDRSSALPAIFEAYQQLADARSGQVRAQVTSAARLTPAQEARIKTTLARITGQQVIVESLVDPSLIGGVVTRIDGKVYDGSLRTQLNSLRQRAAQSA